MSCRFIKNLNQKKKDLNKHTGNILQERYYKRTMLRKRQINLRKAKTLCMYAIDLSTARPKWHQTPVTVYICLYQELNLKIVEYTSAIC